jgi:uncharacterized protein (TIGR00661 family)
MKILYAASNNQNARIQLSRFLRNMDGSDHLIKVAAYKVSSPKGFNIDWTLDALLNIYRPDLLSLDNDNLNVYFDQIKAFAPDLIISDLEYFTSYLAGLMTVPLWQCSSSLLDYGLANKYNLGLFKYYAHSLNRDPTHTQRTVNLITNSSRNLVCSHFGDLEQAPALLDNFEWVRPYHQVSKLSVPCQHNVVAGFSETNAGVLDVLKSYSDSVVFMESCAEKYHNVYVKDIGNEDEYYCNLRNSFYFVCQGQASFLADAFYNGKFSFIYPNYRDTESIINSHLSKRLGLGDIVAHGLGRTFEMALPAYNSSIKYLHEKISDIS